MNIAMKKLKRQEENLRAKLIKRQNKLIILSWLLKLMNLKINLEYKREDLKPQ